MLLLSMASVISFTKVLKEAFVVDQEVPNFADDRQCKDILDIYGREDYCHADSLKKMVVWYVLNRCDNRVVNTVKHVGDFLILDLGEGFTIHPLHCTVYHNNEPFLDFSPQTQEDHTHLFGAWSDILTNDFPHEASTMRSIAKRHLDDNEKVRVVAAEPVKVKSQSFRSGTLYEPLKEFLVALSRDPVPMTAILAITQADNCSESHFFVGNGKLQNLTLEIDDYKVEITSGAICRRVGLKVINRSTLTSLEISAEDFESLLAEL